MEPGLYGTPDGLTADGLLLYLQTRMNGLDDQINTIFQKQQDIEKIRKLLADMQNELNRLNDDEGNTELQGAVASGTESSQPMMEDPTDRFRCTSSPYKSKLETEVKKKFDAAKAEAKAAAKTGESRDGSGSEGGGVREQAERGLGRN